MHYNITIEGGIMGSSRNYQGELPNDFGRIPELKNILEVRTSSLNKQIRDGYTYSFKFTDGKKIYLSEFDEQNLPKILRELIVFIANASN